MSFFKILGKALREQEELNNPTDATEIIYLEMAKYMDHWIAPNHIMKNGFMRVLESRGWIEREMDDYLKRYKTKKDRIANVDNKVEFFCSSDKKSTEKMDREKIRIWITEIIKSHYCPCCCNCSEK